MDNDNKVISNLKKELEKKIKDLKTSENILREKNIELKESMLFSEEILNNVNVAIHLMDLRSNNIVWANEIFYEMFGYSNKEIKRNGGKKYVSKRFHPDDEKILKQGIDILMSNKKNSFSAIFRIKSEEGRWKQIYTNRMVYTRMPDGSPWLILAVSFNLTDPVCAGKQIEDLLKENIVLKNQLLIKNLSVREIEVLKLIAKGYTGKKIADMLNISYYTVDTHRKRIAKKIKAGNIAEMARFAVENGLA